MKKFGGHGALYHIKDQVVIYDESGFITSVGPAASVKMPSGVTPMDLSNATCLPGLIDVHAHVTGDPTSAGYQALGISVPRETVTGERARAGIGNVCDEGRRRGAE